MRVRSESEANLDEVGNRAIGGVERIRRNHSRGGVGTYRPDMFGMLAMLICSAAGGTTRELRIAMSASWRVNVAMVLLKSKCFLRTRKGLKDLDVASISVMIIAGRFRNCENKERGAMALSELRRVAGDGGVW